MKPLPDPIPLKIQSPISKIQSPISKIQSPISKIQSPISKIQSPISNAFNQSPISPLSVENPVPYR